MGDFDPHGTFSPPVSPPTRPSYPQSPTYEGLSHAATDEYAEDGWTAQSLSGEWWYTCDVCKRPLRKSQTTDATQTADQQGLRVCFRCLDQPGREDMLDEANSRLASLASREAFSANKEP